MTKYVVAKNGVVTNIVNAPSADTNAEYWWAVPDAQVVNVGDSFDPRQFQIDAADYVAGQVLFNHENRIRAIVQAIYLITSSVSGASAAGTAGLPPNNQSNQVTANQFRTALLNLLPAVTSIPPSSFYNP